MAKVHVYYMMLRVWYTFINGVTSFASVTRKVKSKVDTIFCCVVHSVHIYIKGDN